MSNEVDICAPGEKHTGLSDWEFGDRLQVFAVYYIANWSRFPEHAGPVRSIWLQEKRKRGGNDIEQPARCDISMRRRLYQRSFEFESQFPNGMISGWSQTHALLSSILSTFSNTQVTRQKDPEHRKRMRLD